MEEERLTAAFSGTGGCERITGLCVPLRHVADAREPTWAGQAAWDGCPGRVPVRLEWWPGKEPDQTDSRLLVSRCVDADGQGAVLDCQQSCEHHGRRSLCYAAVVCSKAFGCPFCDEGGTVTVVVSGEARGQETLDRATTDVSVPAGTDADGDGRPSPTPTIRARPAGLGDGIQTPNVAIGPGGTPRLRAGIITPSLWLGGVERWITQLIEATAGDIDWAGVAIVANDRTQHDALALLRQKVPVHGFSHAAARRLFDCDVLLAWGAPNLPHCVDGYRGRIVLVSHSDYSGHMRHVVRSSARVATHFVAVSEYAKGPFYGWAPDDRVRVIPNGIDTRRCLFAGRREDARKKYGLGPGDYVVGMITRFSPEKRLEVAMMAMDYLPERYKLLVLGSGPIAAEVNPRRIAQARQTQVLLAPPTRDIAAPLAAMDAALLTSESEGFCLSALEALYAGVPLVATPVGVLPELEAAGRACWEPLPADPSPDVVARAIEQVSQQPPWVLESRQRVGRELVEEHYTPVHFGRRWIDYLEEICHETAAPQLVHSH